MAELREVIAARLREARERAGLTQKEVAERAGLAHHQTVSQIERGEREVKAWELATLARVLQVGIGDLLRQEPLKPLLVLWREPPVTDRRGKEARFHRRCERYALVRELTGVRPPPTLLPMIRDLATLSFEDVEALADSVRTTLGLGDYPPESLPRAAEERLGVQIWHEDLGRDGSAACMRGECGAAVLLNASEAPWRRGFSLAHELFHLLTWDAETIGRMGEDGALFRRSETLANVFASALLMPVEAVLRELGRLRRGGALRYADLAVLAGKFGVSTQAMLWRLANLREIAREEARRLANDPGLPRPFAPIDAGWGRPPPLPAEYVRLCFLACANGDLARGRLAEYLEVNPADVEAFLARYNLVELEGAEGDREIPHPAEGMSDESLADAVGW